MTDISSRNSTKSLDCCRIRTLKYLIRSRDILVLKRDEENKSEKKTKEKNLKPTTI
jgi:hypothetical protein